MGNQRTIWWGWNVEQREEGCGVSTKGKPVTTMRALVKREDEAVLHRSVRTKSTATSTMLRFRQ